MKKLLFTLLSVALSIASFAQVAINGDGSNPNASAMLDIVSNSKGLLVPRMTTAQRTAIVTPAKGLMVFDNTTSTFWFYNETAWVEIKSSSLPVASNPGDMLYWNGSQWTIVPRGLTNQVLTMNALGVPEWKSAPPAVYSLAVTPVSSTIVLGQSQQYTATATFTDASTADVSSQVTWTSSNTSVATINASGNATSLAGGTSTITATMGVFSATANLNVSAPTLSVSDPWVTEINSGTSSLIFTVSLSLPSQSPVTVTYNTAHISTSANDYIPASGTLIFAPGETSKTITVLVNGDIIYERREYISLTLSNAQNAIIGDGSAVGTILNDDPEPSISIANASITEGNSGIQNLIFTITIIGQSQYPIELILNPSDLSTTMYMDYQPVGMVYIAPGETTKSVAFPINGDNISESDEVFRLSPIVYPQNIQDPLGFSTVFMGANVTTSFVTGTILNDDPQPTISIENVIQQEQNFSTSQFTFEVSLSAPSEETISVNYATVNGTATTLDGDYTTSSGMLTFAPGETIKQIIVTVYGDVKDETDETFTVSLTNVINATMGTATGTGTIQNDDISPTVSIVNAQKSEGNFSNSTLDFTVNLSAASGKPVTVDYATQNGTATSADNDYVAASGTLTFNPGQTQIIISITINGDTKYEANESFSVSLSNSSNASVSGGAAQGLINNDDMMPVVSISPASVVEGNTGVTNLVFTVSLAGSTSQPVTVNYFTSNGTATIADGDYASTTGTIIFAEGETSKTITVFINGDLKFESNESFNVFLNSPVNASIGTNTATGTISNDDAAPSISIANISMLEGNAGPTSFVFTVTLSAASGLMASVGFSTFDFTAISTGISPDYIPGNGFLSFAPGEISKTITIQVNGDITIEPDELFRLVLSAPVNASLFQSVSDATILNDDN